MITDLEQYIHVALAEKGAREFFKALSSACMAQSQVAEEPPVNSVARSAWLGLSARAAAAMDMAERAGIGHPFDRRT